MNTCDRCGRLCQIATGSKDAQILRRAQRGLCVDCGVTQFLKPLALRDVADPFDHPRMVEWSPAEVAERLRLPHIQAQFAAVMRAGNADASPEEIDWERVIANWALPFPGASGGRGRGQARPMQRALL